MTRHRDLGKFHLRRLQMMSDEANSEDLLRRRAAELVALHRQGVFTEEQCRSNIAHFVVQHLNQHHRLRGDRNEELRHTAIRVAVAYVTQTVFRECDRRRPMKSHLDLDRVDRICQWLDTIIKSSARQAAPRRLGASIDVMFDGEVSTLVTPSAEDAATKAFEDAALDEYQLRMLDLADSIEQHPSRANRVEGLVEFLELPAVTFPARRLNRNARRLARSAGGWGPLLSQASDDPDKAREVLPCWAELGDDDILEAVDVLSCLGDKLRDVACGLLTSDITNS